MRKLMLMTAIAGTLTACTTVTPAEKAQMNAKMDAVQSDTIDVISRHNFAVTDKKLKAAIEARGLKIFTVVNHGEGARMTGQDIGKSKLYLFGNPKSGTPLMIENRKMGLELPMKALVYQAKDGSVHVARPDMNEVTSDYSVTGRDTLIDKISMTLDAIVTEAVN